MLRRNRWSAVSLVLALSAVSSFAQNRAPWRTAADIRQGVRSSMVGTVVDVDDARRQLQVTGDEDTVARVSVITDSVSTQYNGFGGVINGQPEIFTGSSGFANLRVGDRIEIRGVGRTSGVIAAEYVRLLGRSIAASQTGVGSTRPPSSVSTPSATSSATTDRYGRVDGVVRQVNAIENRIVIENDRRQVVTIRTVARTPVYYQGRTYEVSNLEVGDRISVEVEGGTTVDREVRARSIEVTASVQDGNGESRGVGALTGNITRVDRAANAIRVNTGREDVRVDLSRANDASGRRVRAADLQVGDRVVLSGSYSNDVYVATTVRFEEDVFRATPPEADRVTPAPRSTTELVTVSISTTVTETLQSSPVLVVRERTGGRTYEILVAEDFVVRTKTGYTTADKLREGDAVLIKAVRDAEGNLIAQTIRYR